MKRFFAFLLVCCLLSGLCCVTVSATDPVSGSCGDNATWRFDASTGTLTISGTGTAVGVPGDSSGSFRKYNREILHIIFEEGITEVTSSFSNFPYLQSIRFADSLKTIGNFTFFSNYNLTELDLGTGVTSIGSMSFSSSKLTNVILPASLQTIAGEAFSSGSLKNVALPEGTTVIDNGAFRANSQLAKLYLPASVTQVNYAAFRDCDSLTDIYYAGSEEQWNAINIDDTVDGKGPSNGALFTATIHLNHSHSWDSGTVTRQGSCVQKGVKTYTCTVCGAAKQETFSGSHNWDSGKVTAATCTKDGAKVYTCTVCKDTKEEKLAATGHSWDGGTKNPDTTISYNCTKCSAIKIDGTPVTPPDTTAPTVAVVAPDSPSTQGTTAPTEDTTAPTEPETDMDTPDKGFPWGMVIGIGVVVVAAAGAGIWFWLKKKK